MHIYHLSAPLLQMQRGGEINAGGLARVLATHSTLTRVNEDQYTHSGKISREHRQRVLAAARTALLAPILCNLDFHYFESAMEK